MTIYQAELLRRLPQLESTGYYGYRDGLLHIFHEDFPLCRQTHDGFLRFCEDQLDALKVICDDPDQFQALVNRALSDGQDEAPGMQL